MKTKALFLAGALLALVTSGCGDHGTTVNVTDIVSEDGVNDGDITLSGGIYSVVTSNQSSNTILVDFATGTETRGFITFSLATIPVTANVQRATVFLPIRDAIPTLGNSSVALLPDMVTFPPLNTLTTQSAMAGVFDLLDDTVILRGPTFSVIADDAGFDRTFDATDAVIEANREPPLPTLQIRLISAGGAVVIDDLFDPVTGAGTPLLRVEWF